MGVFDFFSSRGGGKKPPANTSARPERPADPARPATSAPARAATEKDKNKKDHKGQPAPAKAPTKRPELSLDAPPEGKRASGRPAAPEKRKEGPAPAARPSASDHEEVDRAIDAAFGAGAARSVTQVSQIAQELDDAAVRELYASIAANHARPIKNLIFELKRGTATKEWIEVCRPVMATLVQGAESMGLPEPARAMADFDEALALAQDGGGETLDGAVRDLILRGFDEMVQALPEAFQAGEEERRRDTIIIHALLKQVPDVGHVTFERLYGAGLTSLEALFVANKDDLAVTTGIPVWLSERICERIQTHRKDLERARRDSGQGERRERLWTLVAELRRRHDGFEQTSASDWSNPEVAEEKKEYRHGRQLCALQIDVVLAEMGELDLVEQIQKLPFGRRIEKLEEFLGSAGTLPPEARAGGVGSPADRPAER